MSSELSINTNMSREYENLRFDTFTKQTSTIVPTIYRYKFTDDVMKELYTFSKIHQYDHRHDFKDAWDKWLEEQDELVKIEVERLTHIGYEGDIIDKMFKSARYYFRKKSTEKKQAIERRNYVGIQKTFLSAIDVHLKSMILTEDFKPSSGFDDFCKTNLDLLKEEVANLCKNGLIDSVEIKNKIKKTYKNRYFLLINV
jgi:hypothetical protein